MHIARAAVDQCMSATRTTRKRVHFDRGRRMKPSSLPKIITTAIRKSVALVATRGLSLGRRPVRGFELITFTARDVEPTGSMPSSRIGLHGLRENRCDLSAACQRVKAHLFFRSASDVELKASLEVLQGGRHHPFDTSSDVL
jgi:hypothetical protein